MLLDVTVASALTDAASVEEKRHSFYYVSGM